MLSLALWLATLVAALVHMTVTRVSVRLLGKGAENAWDNALGYLVITGMLWYPTKWAWSLSPWLVVVALPPVGCLVLIWAWRGIYQVSLKRAAAIGALHSLLTSLALASLTLLTGFIAAYIMYGRIVSDPLLLVRIVLRLIGIEPPF